MSTLRIHSLYVSYICPTLTIAQTETVPCENVTRHYQFSDDDIYSQGKIVGYTTEILVTKCICGTVHTFSNDETAI